MPPEALVVPGRFSLDAMPVHWRQALIKLGLVWTALIVAFAADWLAMFDQWWNSSTYNHVLLVPAIVGWLVWLRAPQLARFEPKPWRWGLLFLAGAVFLWVLGTFAGFNLFRQAGAVAMLPASALLLLGPRLFAALLFPFAYLAFLVPFGDEMVPALQSITAVITIWLVQATGVTATINGVFIDTPAGLFEVAEACSGVKFLIAMIALGALVGNVCFKSWRRRIGFFALCLVVPILANGLRAWGTIFAAQYVGIEKAAGIDHLIYGWIFFALVIAAVMAMSWRFFDRAIDDPMIDAEAIAASPLLGRLENGAHWREPCCWSVAGLAGPWRPQRFPRRCPHRSTCPKCRAGSASTMPRKRHGNRVLAVPIIACWGAIRTRRAIRSMFSMRSMPRKVRARKPVGSGRGP
jgi:exosortase A